MTDGVNTVGLLYRYFCQYNVQGIKVCVNVVTHHDHLHSPTLDRLLGQPVGKRALPVPGSRCALPHANRAPIIGLSCAHHIVSHGGNDPHTCP